MPRILTAARRSYNQSALIARRAVREAQKVRNRGVGAVATVVAVHQVANAQTSQAAVPDMLAEQDITAPVEALLNLPAFTTSALEVESMLAEIQSDVDWQFERLVASLVQDAGRAAESVAVTVRPNIYHVRYVNPPCCARCAILAGRVYRWSEGFQRHPGCDCVMIPTTVASPLRQDPDQLVEDGMVRGLSKADLRALQDGADLGQVVNVRLRSAGLWQAGETALRRGSRPTPAGIYRAANGDRDLAVANLARYGYIRT